MQEVRYRAMFSIMIHVADDLLLIDIDKVLSLFRSGFLRVIAVKDFLPLMQWICELGAQIDLNFVKPYT